MPNDIGNYAEHARFWDWSGHDRTAEHEYWLNYARKYGNNVLIPMCALGESGAYMAQHGMNMTAFDVTPEMIAEGKKRLGGIPGLRLYEGDVRDFRFDIQPADFCFSMDFWHILTIEDVKKALVCINYHLRDGGGLIIEATLPPTESSSYPLQTFMPVNQVYPDLTVWKTGEGHIDAETGRHYISQIFYAEDKSGHVESFDHSFYLQSYSHDEWHAAFKECGFDIVRESGSREVESWQSGGSGFHTFEAVKSTTANSLYSPTINLDYLQTPIFAYENVSLYNDVINLQQPNTGLHQFYRFDINADGEWAGWIHIWIGYSIRIRYCGQIGYEIKEEFRNHGYATKACLALLPFLRKCGYKHVLITTDENNSASRRVCEKIGASLLEMVDTPTWTNMYNNGQRRTCVYDWNIESLSRKQCGTLANLHHAKIDLIKDRDYIFERHCRINYECDTPWARRISYAEYRTIWFTNNGQQEDFLTAFAESVKDAHTIAEIITTESGEAVGYLWVPFHGEDPSFVWADIQDIYVEENWRRMGVAEYLVDYAEKAAKLNGAKAIRSGTGCDNVNSQWLHKKMGYYQYRMEYEKVLQ